MLINLMNVHGIAMLGRSQIICVLLFDFTWHGYPSTFYPKGHKINQLIVLTSIFWTYESRCRHRVGSKHAASQNSLPKILTLGALANLSATTDRSRMKRVLPDARLFPANLIKLLSKGS